ncbi:lectin-like domain-containing protein [Carnobacterium maltaromaticum]|uniref:lectin-like domain-containing protein n=1 Tax=Carnobacterium maltaromaticum TaxID=2751 RepID=UPI0039B08844
MKKNLSSTLKLLFLSSVFLFTYINIVEAAPASPVKGVPVSGVFSVPAGSNSFVDPGGKMVTITKAQQSQVGSIFSTPNNLLDLNYDFSASMFIYLGDTRYSAGDGMTFVMHNDIESTKKFSAGVGEQLGVYAKRRSGSYIMTQQIKNSFAIEFDTYFNAGGMDTTLWPRNNEGHVAYSFPNRQNYYSFGPELNYLHHIAVYYPNDYLANGKWKPFEVKWNATSKVLSYKFDVAPLVEVPIDTNLIFSSDKVYWGFTGSTGANVAETAVVFNKVPGLVNVTENLNLVNQKGETVKDKQVAEKESITATFDINYLNGKQNLLLPTVELALEDKIHYKKGTLKYNGIQMDDSKWIDKSFVVPTTNLSLTNPKASISFDVETEDVGRHDVIKTGASATIKADNYTGDTNKLAFSVKGKGDTLTLTSDKPSINLTSSEIEEVNVLKLTNSQILQRFITNLNIVAHDPEGNTADGITIQAVDETVYDRIRNLKSGVVNLDLIAKKTDNSSSILSIQVIFQNGALSFSSVPETIDFIEGDPAVSLGLVQAVPNKSLSINDTRVSGSPWKLQVTATSLKTDSGQALKGELSYANSKGANLAIGSTIQTIENGTKPIGNSVVDISKVWSKDKGLRLTIANDNYLGTYKGTLNWTLTDVP